MICHHPTALISTAQRPNHSNNRPTDLNLNPPNQRTPRNFFGNFTFVYSTTDGVDPTPVTATVYITILPPDENCITAVDDYYTGVFNTPYSPPAGALIIANDESCSLSPQIEVVAAGDGLDPLTGTLTSFTTTGSFVFTPVATWSGNTTFNYTVYDRSNGLNTTATVHIKIMPSGASCVVAMDNNYTGVYNTPFSLPPGDWTTWILYNDASCSPVPQLEVVAVGPVTPLGGEVTSYTPNGSFVFTPNTSWVGEVTFSYTITDKSINENATANVYITFPPPGANCVKAVDDYYTGVYNQPYSPPTANCIMANDSSCNTVLQLEVTAAGPIAVPSNGALTSFAGNGSFVFTPTIGWWGTASFPYTIIDLGFNLNASATVYITIPPPSPTCVQAVNDYYTGVYNQPFSPPLGFFITGNDTSCNPSPRLEVVWAGFIVVPSNGVLTSYERNGTFVFTPTIGWSGTASFPYTITDMVNGQNASAIVYITIPPPGSTCVQAVDDYYTGLYNQPYSPPSGSLILGNDTSCNPTPQLEVVAAGPITIGSGNLISWSPNGSFVFTPTQGWSGRFAFPYTITDKVNGQNSSAMVYITIPPPGPVYTITPANYTFIGVYSKPFVPPEGSFLLSRIQATNPVAQLSVTRIIVPLPAKDGTLTVDPNGKFRFKPAPAWSGVWLRAHFTGFLNRLLLDQPLSKRRVVSWSRWLAVPPPYLALLPAS